MSGDLQSRVQAGLLRYCATNTRVLMAVSGGVDSMTMLDVLASLRLEMGLDLHVAHVNHGLRADSHADVLTVQTVAEKHGFPFYSVEVDVRAKAAQTGSGLEAAARQLRYEFLARTAELIGAELVMTGHTADDVVETVLMNIARGGSIDALSGIPAERALTGSVRIVRPLLESDRADVLDYARKVGLVWTEDSTNTEERFLRNRVRHELLPTLTSVFGAAIGKNILRLAGTMAEVAALIDDLNSDVRRKMVRSIDGNTVIDLETMAGSARLLTDELLRKELNLTLADRERIHGLLPAEVGSLASLSGNRQALRERSHIVVRHQTPSEQLHDEFEIRLDDEFKSASYRMGTSSLEVIKLENADRIPEMSATSVVIDLERISGPLQCRPWRDGDRISLKGLNGSKLVSDLLTDLKVPHSKRRQIHVLADDQGILWVCGIRPSDRVGRHDETAHCIHCQVLPGLLHSWNP